MLSTIHSRLIWTLSLLVGAVGLVIGWTSIQVAGSVIEQRLIHESVHNTAELVEQMNLPLSPRLMTQLQQILGCHLLAIADADQQVLASSLPPEATRQVMAQPRPALAKVYIGAETFRVGRASFVSARDGTVQLLLLAPLPRLQEARQHAIVPIAGFAMLAVTIATLIGWALAKSITRPLQQLAKHMHALTDEVDNAGVTDTMLQRDPTHSTKQIRELAELTTAFATLLAHLHQAQTRLAEAARLATLGKMSAALAHEIRNPLSAIKMNARVVMDGLPAKCPDQVALQLIMREIDRLDLSLRDLLQLAQPTTGNAAMPQPRPEPVNVEQCLRSLQSLLAGRRHFTWQLHVNPAAWVAASEAQLRQVLLNLVLNAMDAMPNGGTITWQCTDAPPNHIEISLTDTGPGVDATTGLNVFAPFVSSKPHGAGLGLYICQQIVQSWHGQMGYANSEAGGARFWILLPAAGGTLSEERVCRCAAALRAARLAALGSSDPLPKTVGLV